VRRTIEHDTSLLVGGIRLQPAFIHGVRNESTNILVHPVTRGQKDAVIGRHGGATVEQVIERRLS